MIAAARRRSFLAPLLVLAGMILSTSAAMAQDNYHLGAGDIVKIEVLGEEDFTGSMQINNNGAITMKMIGDIPVAGLTLMEVKDKIEKILIKDFLVAPQVKVEIVEYKSKKIVVLGEVKKPGEFFLNRDWITLLDVISMVSGLTENASDRFLLFRKKSGGQEQVIEKQEISLNELLAGRENPNEFKVLPDDVLNFPSKKSENIETYQVFIEGKVKNPGLYDFSKGMTVYTLCMKAGGFLPFSAENRAYIVRTTGGKMSKIKVNIKKIKNGEAADILLEPGDKVIIPESWY